MPPEQIHPSMTAIVSMVTDSLTDLELAVLNIVAMTDGDPHNRLFDYEEVSSLFTNGKMHAETMIAKALFVSACILPLLNSDETSS